MTRFLARVATPEDAAIALDGGADIIEIGPAEPSVVSAFVRAVGRFRPVCATATGHDPADVQAMAEAGADYIKVVDPSEAAVRALAPIAAGHRLIAVVGVHQALGFDLLRDSGFAGVTLDTALAQETRLLDAVDVTALATFVGDCRTRGLSAGLAGGLEAPDVPRLLVLEPDVLGFQGALTRGGHAGVDARAVRTIRGLIPRPADLPDPPSPEQGDEGDTVFVRDLVLPVSVGAYAREHAATQRVRFAVEAQLAPLGRPAHGLRDVLSYDIIIDGIRLLIAEGHVALIETLAERIAAMLLGYPRVQRVTVRLEKLDRDNGVAGTEIVRRRRGGPRGCG